MRFEVLLRYVGVTLLLNAAALALSGAVSAIYGDSALLPLLYSALICACLGLFPLIFVPPTRELSAKEGLAVVVGSWLASCLVGTLPYLLYGGPFGLTNAWFESVSGYTTTGATILAQIETLPHGLLFWRATTHWLGGVGIVLFVLAVLPFVGLAEMVLVRNEVSAMAQDSFQARARKVIRIISVVYFGLTLAEIVALLLCGMGLFDAVTHSFATIATGGFSPRNASVAYFHSVSVEMVILFFMVASGMNFGLLFTAALGRVGALWRSEVLRFYLGSMLVAVALTTVDLQGETFQSWATSLRHAAFQVASVATSTGFATVDSSIWPWTAQLLLILMTLQCACSGSTSGGIKVDRIVVLWKAFLRQIRLLLHPRAVIPVRLEGRRIEDALVSRSLLFILTYLVFCSLATLALCRLGMDLISAFSGTVACMGNVGPGLGTVGSTGNYGHLPATARWLLSGMMLLGRLEIWALLLFLSPAQWRRSASY